MKYYAQIESSQVCSGVKAIGDNDTLIPEGGRIFVVIPSQDPSYLGRIWNGLEWSDAPPEYRTIITAFEWYMSWTPAEWRTLKKAASGEMSPSPVPDNVSERIDQLIDAIRSTDSFNLASDTANTFYGYLEARGFIDAARRAELVQGVLE